jgi:PAS domain S-box-containing protein
LCTAAVVQDATERKIAEEALRESEERYKALYENNPSMYFTLDEEGMVLSINRFGAEQLGYTVEELIGRSMLNIFHEEDREGILRHLHKCLQEPSGKTSAWEARKVRKDGSTFWVRENLRIVQSPYGYKIVLVTCEDISERKRADEERERSLARELQVRAQSEERRRISRELHDRVAHTMGVVHQSLELYEALKGHDAAAAEAKIELAREMAKEALASTRNLSMELRRPDVKQGLQAALENILHDIVPPTVHHELVAEGDESLLPPRVRNQLFLILREAVRNAITHSGCDRLTVELDTTPQRVVGIVEDDGQGFEPEKVRSNNGLRSMQERASLVGGTLDVSSDPGAGTRIKMSVPLKGS